MEKIKFGGGTNHFQKGLIVTINSALGLFDNLKSNFGMEYVMLSHTDQDYVESTFGVFREGGGVRIPSALRLQYRVQRELFYIHIYLLLIFFWLTV